MVRNQMVYDFKKNRVWAESAHIIMQIGLTMVGCIGFCFFIGRLLDQCLGTKGIFVAVFTVLGVLGGANVVYRQIIKITDTKEPSDPPSEKDKAPKNGSL